VISTYWLKSRKPHWDRLQKLLEYVSEHGINSLTRSELRELGLLYRQIASDLSTAREDRGADQYARYLNQLLGQAHNVIYAGRRSDPWGILRFYATTFPQTFRRMLPYTTAAFAMFLAGAVAGGLLTFKLANFARFFLGAQMMDTIEHRQMWTHSVVSIAPLASSSIMTNNISVSFATFAMGMTAGIGTLYMMVFNGLLLGVIGAACWQSGMSVQLWSFVAPHGVLELPAIFIAGGAGLRVAHGILFPGYLPRKESIARAGQEAVRLALGCLPILIVAGIIEGFVSPSSLPVMTKFLLAMLLFAAFVLYLARTGLETSTATTGSVLSTASTG